MYTHRVASLSLIAMLSLFACSDTSTGGADASASQDAGASDAAADVGALRDTSGDVSVDVASSDPGSDASASDMGEDAQADVGVDATLDVGGDASEDAGEDAGVVEPDPRCMFLDLDVRYVTCDPGEDYQLLRYFEDRNLGDELCPPYIVLRGTRYDTAEEALSGESCDGTCAWSPQNSFTVLRCGRRTGYELWSAPDCDDIYVTPDGVYPSVEAWEFSNPCP